MVTISVFDDFIIYVLHFTFHFFYCYVFVPSLFAGAAIEIARVWFVWSAWTGWGTVEKTKRAYFQKPQPLTEGVFSFMLLFYSFSFYQYFRRLFMGFMHMADFGHCYFSITSLSTTTALQLNLDTLLIIFSSIYYP